MMGLRRGWAMKSIMVTIITSIWFLCVSAGTNHIVGGASGWNPTSNVQGWAAVTTFQVGDFLVFRYTLVYNVLEVSRLDYLRCQGVHPIRTHNDRVAVIQLTQPGPRYFICGRQVYCKMGLRLQVQVLPLLLDDNDSGATFTTATVSPSSSTTTSSPSDGGDDQANRHPNHPSAPPTCDCHPPRPPPAAAPAPSNDKGGGIEVPSIGSDNGLQDKLNNPASATSAPPPCTCGAGEVVISLLLWCVPVITTLVMLVS